MPAYLSRKVHIFTIPPSSLQCFRKEAAIHTKNDFNNKVKTACQEQRTGTVGWVPQCEAAVCDLLYVALIYLLLLLLFFSADLKYPRSSWWGIWLWGKPAWLIGKLRHTRFICDCKARGNLGKWITQREFKEAQYLTCVTIALGFTVIKKVWSSC